MKKYILLFIAVTFTMNIFAQGKQISEVLPKISSIMIDGDMTVTLVNNSKENRFEGTIPDDQQKYFSWQLVDSCELVVTLKNPLNLGNNSPLTPINLKIYVSDLKNIQCKKDSRIISDDTFESRIFTIDASRNAVVSLRVKCFDLTAYCSHSAVLNLRGTSDFVVLQSSYGANINNRELETESTTVTATSDSEVHVKATQKLLLTAKTKATIHYKKGDAIATKTERSLGKVIEYE